MSNAHVDPNDVIGENANVFFTSAPPRHHPCLTVSLPCDIKGGQSNEQTKLRRRCKY